MKVSQKQATIAALKALGYVDTYRSGKYQSFQLKGSKRCYLVGRSGALRVTHGPIARSVRITGSAKHRFIAQIGRCVISGQELSDEQREEILRRITPANKS